MGYGYDTDGDEVDPFIQEILDEISMDAFDPPEAGAPEPAPEPETAPTPEDDPDAEELYVSPALDDRILPMPVPGVPLSASAEAAAYRRLEAQRKREEREERRSAGLPDWRTVDTAVSAALAEVLRTADAPAFLRVQGTAKELKVDGAAVLRTAIRTLIAKGCSKAAASRAVAERLLER